MADTPAKDRSGPKEIDATEGPTSLVTKLATAMSEAAEVTKDRTNTDQGWKFASVESMLKAVRGPLLERGVILSQQPTNVENSEITSSRGSKGASVTVTIDFTFRDGETGETFTITGWTGNGQDYGDKAYGKAYTNAVKTFIRAQWLLPTENDDDPDRTSTERVANDAGAQLPVWAKAATRERMAEAGRALEGVIGTDRARRVFGSVRASLDVVPDVLIPTIKLIASEYAEEHPDDYTARMDAAQKARAEEAARKKEAEVAHADAENGDPPAAPEDPPAEEVDAEPVEEPPPGVGEPPPPEAPAAGSVDPADAGEERARELCTCPDGYNEGDPSDQCPIKGHGIPF